MLSAVEIADLCPALAGLPGHHLRAVAACSNRAPLVAGRPVFREGEPAYSFYILARGHVSLQVRPPGREPITIQTIREGEILGWSWLFEPRRWHFDALALENGEAVRVDAAGLRAAFEVDPQLQSELVSRFARVMLERLQATRLQLLDVYGDGPANRPIAGDGPGGDGAGDGR